MIKAITLGVTTAILALMFVVRTGQAGIMYQTVPTMPPPTATRTKTPLHTATYTYTPQQTSLYTQQPTATGLQATSTHINETMIPQTATMEVIASETAQTLPTIPTSVPSQATHISTLNADGTATVIATGITRMSTVFIKPTPSQAQDPVEERFTLGLYGLVGGGSVLLVLVLVNLFRIRKRNHKS